jgi:hypothetical protein
LILNAPPTPFTVEGDSVRLTQVFANLINNAAKYTDVGGHIWIDVRAQDHEAVVTVRDDGIGIAAEHLSAVFDMFTQVNRSDRRTQGGLGIGLTLVRSLVGVHRGSVAARSDGIGCGTTFEVRLPLVADRRPCLDEPGTLGPFPNCRVLVVDDNAPRRWPRSMSSSPMSSCSISGCRSWTVMKSRVASGRGARLYV